ncbi:hypothetical protein ACF1GY_09590 [Streptomyces sp. NPDC014684]|uniref:hypothetical protein n=1 Tax=Streptomyces sp. NPDC014684 TaxID=3364880 RepID=UPI0036FEB61B
MLHTEASGSRDSPADGHAPSECLQRLAKAAETSPDGVEQRVRTHLADPGLMRADDFDAFFEERQKVLQEHIAAAMGKPVADDHIPGQRPEAAVRTAESGLEAGVSDQWSRDAPGGGRAEHPDPAVDEWSLVTESKVTA